MSMLDRIRKAAGAKGWDLQQLADECGIKRPQINQIAAAKRGTSKHLPRIAKALGISIEWLVTGAPGLDPIWYKTGTSPAVAVMEKRRSEVQVLFWAPWKTPQKCGVFALNRWRGRGWEVSPFVPV